MSTTVRDAIDEEIERQMPPLAWTPEMFRLASAAGCFEDLNVELLPGGRIVAMTDNPPHTKRAINCERALLRVLPEPDWFVAREICVRLPGWTPKPDVVVARGPRAPRYDERLPGLDDLVLLVEVCDTTYLKDRFRKLPDYFAAGVPACWLINIPEARIEVYENRGGGDEPEPACYGPEDAVPVVIDGAPRALIPVADVLGRP